MVRTLARPAPPGVEHGVGRVVEAGVERRVERGVEALVTERGVERGVEVGVGRVPVKAGGARCPDKSRPGVFGC